MRGVKIEYKCDLPLEEINNQKDKQRKVEQPNVFHLKTV